MSGSAASGDAERSGAAAGTRDAPPTEPEPRKAAPPALDLAAFDFELPADRIAQAALPERDASKLLVLERSGPAAAYGHHHVRDLPSLLSPGDLLVVNTTRVLPARLVGRRESGGAAEALVLGPEGDPSEGRFRALVKISGRLRPGIRFTFEGEPAAGATERARTVDATVLRLLDAGEVVLSFGAASPFDVGRAPLPPYIRRGGDAAASETRADLDRYQTVYARVPGAIAAPTAGLHLTERVFQALEDRGVQRAEVVLHVGPGTFRPLRDEDLRAHRLHAEAYELSPETAEAIDATRERGGRVIAVGTTVARVLESRAAGAGRVHAGAGETEIFLMPGDRFRVVDGLMTNFHLPRSSLLLLVAAFAGRERILEAYREALARAYRFYSYGDAMLIL